MNINKLKRDPEMPGNQHRPPDDTAGLVLDFYV
jgi:hypothetical protein